jgi:hypothetical protein
LGLGNGHGLNRGIPELVLDFIFSGMGMSEKKLIFFTKLGLVLFELLYLLERVGGGGKEERGEIGFSGSTFFLVGWKEIPLLPAICVFCCFGLSLPCHAIFAYVAIFFFPTTILRYPKVCVCLMWMWTDSALCTCIIRHLI